MEISFHSHLDPITVIATKFCTWHDSCAVVACAKICCDLMASNGVMARRSFHRIWIAGIKTLVKRAPGVFRCEPNMCHIHIDIYLLFFVLLSDSESSRASTPSNDLELGPRSRTNFTREQVRALKAVFEDNQYPDKLHYDKLSDRLQLDDKCIRVSIAMV